MSELLSFQIQVGILLTLTAIIVYCTYKTIATVPQIWKAIKEYKQAQEELKEFLRNQKSLKEDLEC